MNLRAKNIVCTLIAGSCLGVLTAQQGGRGPAQTWWVAKTKGGVYVHDITPGRYTLVRNLDDVVARAQDAVSVYASEAPNVFRYGRYGTDFITKSLGFVDLDFRRAHGFSEQTLLAFSKYAHFVRPQTQ